MEQAHIAPGLPGVDFPRQAGGYVFIFRAGVIALLYLEPLVESEKRN